MSFLRAKVQYAAPTTGQTVTIANASADVRLILNPSGTLVNLTIEMPSAPYEGQMVQICTSQIVTSLTMSFAGIILDALATLAGAHSYGKWVYCSTGNSWYRAG